MDQELKNMKFKDFDAIIKRKLHGTNSIYNSEMAAAKPFIWEAIQKNLNKPRWIQWLLALHLQRV